MRRANEIFGCFNGDNDYCFQVVSFTLKTRPVIFSSNPIRLSFRPWPWANAGRKKFTATNNTNALPLKIPHSGWRIRLISRSRDGFKKCPNPLEPGQSCRVYVEFCPPLFHTYEGALVFSGSEHRIPLTGRGFQSGR